MSEIPTGELIATDGDAVDAPLTSPGPIEASGEPAPVEEEEQSEESSRPLSPGPIEASGEPAPVEEEEQSEESSRRIESRTDRSER